MFSVSNVCLLGLAFLFRTVVGDDSLGRWGDVFNMEVIPIHVIFLPDGTVLSYGANKSARQGGRGDYEIWDTTSGRHDLSANHVRMRHNTDVNIFCSTLSMDISTGNILIMGGDDDDNNGVNDVLEFDIETHQIRKHPLGDMRYPRWYGTSVNLPDGRIFIVGGRSVKKESSSIPEIWDPVSGFRALPGADVPALRERRSSQRAWWYPHVHVNSKGDILIIISDWQNYDVYHVRVDGDGSIVKVGTRPFRSDKLGAAIMYDIDRVVMLDDTGNLWSVDISDSANPLFTRKQALGENRMNAAMAVLPDGRVAINGGCTENASSEGNELDCAVREAQIWDPINDTVYSGPKQSIPRLYHSSGLVLPDGSVFSAGGGAPGPLKNHNGQIYYPGYLFDPKTGEPASRPAIESWPKNLLAGRAFRITVAVPTDIAKVTATKTGSMTHARNSDARWLNLDFRVYDPTTIEVYTPGRTIMLPGLWHLNVVDKEGVPSLGRIMGVSMAILGPTSGPTSSPSAVPSSTPSAMPSVYPTQLPSTSPSNTVTVQPVAQRKEEQPTRFRCRGPGRGDDGQGGESGRVSREENCVRRLRGDV